jgi:hypothetical protein
MEVIMEPTRNNWTNEHTVHGPVQPKGWELMLELELTRRLPG